MLILHADNLANLPGIAHGFFGRTGGVSQGIYASLNCGPGSGDEAANVRANRSRVAAALGANVLNTLYQIHSSEAARVTAPWETGPRADAMVTDQPGIALGILTADCAPILFADAEAHVIGAAHAGWKGALAGIVTAAIAAMESLGAQRTRIRAAIGPCISQKNYEVGDDFRDRFLAADSANSQFFAAGARAGHCQFDLAGYVSHLLEQSGIAAIAQLGGCTYADEERFFSFRRTTHRAEKDNRATHRGESDYGRQLSAIVLA